MDWTVRGSNCSRGKRIFSSPECPDWLWGHPVSYSLHTEVLSWGYSGWGMKFTTHQCLVLRLRMSGTVPLLPYAFMAWTMKPVFFFLLCVDAVIVFLLLLTFFEFYAYWYRKFPVCHFFPQSSIFNLLRALFILCPTVCGRHRLVPEIQRNLLCPSSWFCLFSTFKMGASVSSSSLIPMQKRLMSYPRTLYSGYHSKTLRSYTWQYFNIICLVGVTFITHLPLI